MQLHTHTPHLSEHARHRLAYDVVAMVKAVQGTPKLTAVRELAMSRVKFNVSAELGEVRFVGENVGATVPFVFNWRSKHGDQQTTTRYHNVEQLRLRLPEHLRLATTGELPELENIKA